MNDVMTHGLLRISCSRNPKTPQIRSFFYEKWLLFGVLRVPSSKALSCKHERLFDLLTLVSSYHPFVRQARKACILFFFLVQ